MVDTRFHPFVGALPLSDVLTGAGHEDLIPQGGSASVILDGAEELEVANGAHIALAANRKYLDALKKTGAGVVIVGKALSEDAPDGVVVVPTANPHGVFADILSFLYPDDTRAQLKRMCSDGDAPILEDGVVIGANAVVGPGAEIGADTILGPNCIIGAGVKIGRNAIVGSGASIQCAFLGDNVVVHSGARVGTEGFGWLELGNANRKIPQLGRVIVQDNVEIGANSTIDRGALGDTVIGEGTKIDNLVQIGHNCRIGRYCLIAATTGLSGSTNLEDGVLLGGGVGTSGHLTIGAGTVVYGRAAVTKDWPARSKISGAPAQDAKDHWRETIALRRLTKGDEK